MDGTPKWMVIVQAKNTPNASNLSTQFFCPCPKNLNFNEKWLHWASVVGGSHYHYLFSTPVTV